MNVSSSQKIVGNTIFSTLSELSLVFTSVFYILATRFLGTVEYGKFGAAIGFVGLFTLFIIFGFSYSITKVINKEREKAGIFVGNALYIEMVLAVLFLCISSLVVYALKSRYPVEVRTLIIIVFLAESLKCFNLTLRAACKALGFFHYDTIAVNAERIFLLGAGAFFMITGHGVFVIATVLALSRLISFILLFFFMHQMRQTIFIRPSISLCKKLIRKSWEYVIQSAFWRVYDHIDVVMISLMRSFQEVGWYRAGRQILDGLWMIPNMITEATYPELNARHLVSRDLVQKLFERAFKYMLTVSVMVSLGTMIIAKPLVELLYRSDYNRAAIVLILLGFAVIPSYLRYLFGNTLIAINLQKKETIVAAYRSGFNICANAALIPFYGYVGATLATVATDYLAIIVYIIIFKKEGLMNRAQLGFVYKPLLAGILLSPIYFLFSGLYAFISFMIFITLYIAAVFVLKIFDDAEIEVFKKYIRDRRPFSFIGKTRH